MGKGLIICGGVVWFVMAVFAVCLWVTVDYSYNDMRMRIHVDTCTLLDCVVRSATCSRTVCASSISNRHCWEDRYTCYHRDVTLELDVGVTKYIANDTTTHKSEPRTCIKFDRGFNQVTCYYDDRKIQSSLTMSSTRFMKGPIIGVAIMSVATGVVFIATVVFSVLCVLSIREECGVKWRRQPVVTPAVTQAVTTTRSDLLDTPGGDTPYL